MAVGSLSGRYNPMKVKSFIDILKLCFDRVGSSFKLIAVLDKIVHLMASLDNTYLFYSLITIDANANGDQNLLTTNTVFKQSARIQ